MTDDRTARQNFFSRMFGPGEGEGTSIYSPGEVGMEHSEGPMGEPPGTRGFTVQKAAEIIKGLPPEVPRSAAVSIVRRTLEAAGIDVDSLGSSTRARESKLNSAIDLSQNRIQNLKDETEEVIRSLEDEIRKAREARNFGVSEEERKIYAAQAGLEDVERVRDFFDLPSDEPEEYGGQAYEEEVIDDDIDDDTDDHTDIGDETQVIGNVDDEADETQILRRPGPLSDSDDYWNTRDDR